MVGWKALVLILALDLGTGAGTGSLDMYGVDLNCGELWRAASLQPRNSGSSAGGV